MFVVYTCGCVALRDERDRPIVIQPCDLSGEDCWTPLRFRRRTMTGPDGHAAEFEPLDHKKIEALLVEFNRLVSDGYRFRQIQSLLKT